MRPLVVDLGRDYRGGQHQALLLLQGLLERGHAPKLITLQDSLLAKRAQDAGVCVEGIDQKRRRLAAVFCIRRFVRGGHVDVVHANEPHALTSAWLARAHRSVPVIASRRIALPLSPGSFSIARYRAAARIVAVSRFVEKSVIESGLPSRSIEVIYDGVEIPAEISRAKRDRARADLGVPPGCPCVGNVAAFVPEKGQETLLRAFAKLSEQVSGCMLLLCGEGPEMARLQELARRLQILKGVKFISPMPEIQTVFAAIDVFAFPSHEEPLGSALLAAMAEGLPVVAVGRGGIPEVVQDRKNGLLVESLDPDALATGIGNLFANPDEAVRLGRAARETISACFSDARMIEETLRLYEDVTARPVTVTG